MTDLIDSLNALRRPRLLIRAARHGLTEYNRNRDLRRVMRAEPAAGPARVVARLMALEAEQEAIRQAGDAAYSVARHVEVLIALMAEAALLRAADPAARPAP
jgi:hypothetical protein